MKSFIYNVKAYNDTPLFMGIVPSFVNKGLQPLVQCSCIFVILIPLHSVLWNWTEEESLVAYILGFFVPFFGTGPRMTGKSNVVLTAIPTLGSELAMTEENGNLGVRKNFLLIC